MRVAHRFALLITLLTGLYAAPSRLCAETDEVDNDTTSQETRESRETSELVDTEIDFAVFDQFDNQDSEILPLTFQQPIVVAEPFDVSDVGSSGVNIADFQGRFSNDPNLPSIGVDLYSPPEFAGGLLIFGDRVAMKIGGYVKADFIYDFDPIDSTDTFVTTKIPVGAPDRTNARFHARQTRMSFDTRWNAQDTDVRIFVEGDFFSDQDRFRLRHAYGESGCLLVGQTWTTFTDVAAAPATLDFEGSVSSVNRRQAQARVTGSLPHGMVYALAVEDTSFIIEPPTGVQGEARSPSPDFVAHIRADRDWGRFQIAYLYRVLGFQPVGQKVVTSNGWGFNTTAVVVLTRRSKAYSQVVFGEGIGSYRGLPDAAPSSNDEGQLLGLLGWMIGFTQEWTDTLSSNFTYAENHLDNAALQRPDEVHKTSYLAANLLCQPLDRVTVGIEYLYGIRENIDGGEGEANRVQVAFIFDLP